MSPVECQGHRPTEQTWTESDFLSSPAPKRGSLDTCADLNSSAGDAFPSLNIYVSKQALGSLQILTAQPQSPLCRNTPKRHC